MWDVMSTWPFCPVQEGRNATKIVMTRCYLGSMFISPLYLMVERIERTQTDLLIVLSVSNGPSSVLTLVCGGKALAQWLAHRTLA